MFLLLDEQRGLLGTTCEPDVKHSGFNSDHSMSTSYSLCNSMDQTEARAVRGGSAGLVEGWS